MVIEVYSIVFGTYISYSKIVSNLSNLFEDPDSVRDTGHALVLLLNTYAQFQTVIEVYCTAFGTRWSYSKIVSNLSNLFEDPNSVRDTGLALVLLLNTYMRFQGGT